LRGREERGCSLVRCRVLPSWALVDASAHPGVDTCAHTAPITEDVVVAGWEESVLARTSPPDPDVPAVRRTDDNILRCAAPRRVHGVKNCRGP